MSDEESLRSEGREIDFLEGKERKGIYPEDYLCARCKAGDDECICEELGLKSEDNEHEEDNGKPNECSRVPQLATQTRYQSFKKLSKQIWNVLSIRDDESREDDYLFIGTIIIYSAFFAFLTWRICESIYSNEKEYREGSLKISRYERD